MESEYTSPKLKSSAKPKKSFRALRLVAIVYFFPMLPLLLEDFFPILKMEVNFKIPKDFYF
jgi:hypothetical protein